MVMPKNWLIVGKSHPYFDFSPTAVHFHTSPNTLRQIQNTLISPTMIDARTG